MPAHILKKTYSGSQLLMHGKKTRELCVIKVEKEGESWEAFEVIQAKDNGGDDEN